MNVLILTPDAVGSTLLQRTLTIYMQLHQFDRPVINLHELTNGLAKYYSPVFNQEIVSKHTLQQWGYFQTLAEIVEMLRSVDHYKTSRLAHYHLLNRGDDQAQLVQFYNYLNENYYIIACQRANVFEHALSMTMTKLHKKLNVYSANEKIHAFYDFYTDGLTLDPQVFVWQLEAYQRYMQWSQQYFHIARVFNYETDVPNLEKFILNLPVFANQPQKITWEKNFGISFNDWNRMHFAGSDLGSIMHSLTQNNQTQLSISDATEAPQCATAQDWPPLANQQTVDNLPDTSIKHLLNQQGVPMLWDNDKRMMYYQLRDRYLLAQQTIEQMRSLGIIISGPPIKKQTLAEKQHMIHNFSELLDIYNQWAERNPDFGQHMTTQAISQEMRKENCWWDLVTNATANVPALPPSQQ